MKKTLYICDFDGTITMKDTLDYVALKYFPEDYMAWKDMFINGDLNIKSWLKAFEERFDIDKKEYDKTLLDLKIDETFEEFLENKEIIILSGGFKYNIEKILSKENIKKLNIYANEFDFIGVNKVRINMKHFNEDCTKCGVCKTKVLKSYRDSYDEIIYIGDGVSDLCVSEHSDKIFAKKGSYLEEYLMEQKRDFTSFVNFSEIH